MVKGAKTSGASGASGGLPAGPAPFARRWCRSRRRLSAVGFTVGCQCGQFPFKSGNAAGELSNIAIPIPRCRPKGRGPWRSGLGPGGSGLVLAFVMAPRPLRRGRHGPERLHHVRPGVHGCCRSQGLFQHAVDRQRRLSECRHGPGQAVSHRWIGADSGPLVLPQIQIASGQILHRGWFVAFTHHHNPVQSAGPGLVPPSVQHRS